MANTDGGLQRIGFLDYLRIIAFVSVLLGHLSFSGIAHFIADPDIHPTPRLLAQSITPIINEGGVGVVLFFLISGYIITLVSRREQVAEYTTKRIFRIYPLYIVAVLVSYLLAEPTQRLPFKILLMQLSLLGDFLTLPYTLGGVEWTLRIEVYFYILMGFISFLARCHPLFESQKLPCIYLFLVVLIGVLPPFTSGKLGWGGGWQSTGAVTLYFPFLLLGSLLFLRELKYISNSFLVGASALIYGQYFILMTKYQPRWSGDHHAIIALFIFVLFWKFRKFLLVNKFILFASGLTYSTYLLHMWVFPRLLVLFRSLIGNEWLSSLSAWIGLFAVCSVFMYAIEKPGILLGKKLIQSFGFLSWRLRISLHISITCFLSSVKTGSRKRNLEAEYSFL